jgi:hypothetical protein
MTFIALRLPAGRDGISIDGYVHLMPSEERHLDSAAEDSISALALWDYRRRVSDLYRQLRSLDPETGHRLWITTREELFRNHPQSPLSAGSRASFSGLPYWQYDSELRVAATVEPVSGTAIRIPHSAEGTTGANLFGRLHFRLDDTDLTLDMFWLDDYGGGVFVPFRDRTNGRTTYGGGRYLLDSAKGADLGHEGTQVVLDFNFAYHPSCVYSPRWSCPLAPPGNTLDVPVPGGERLPDAG